MGLMMSDAVKQKINRTFLFKVAREQLGLIAATYSFLPSTVAMKTFEDFSQDLVEVNFPSNPAEAMRRDVEVIAKDLKTTLATNLK